MKQLGLAAWLILGAGSLLVVIGLVVFFSGVGNLRPRDELDPISLVQLGVTLLVGFYLTQYLAQRTAERKAERDLLIEAIRDCAALVRSAIGLYGQCCDKRDDAELRASLVRDTSVLGWHMWTIEVLFDECAVAKREAPIKTAVTEMMKFRRLATKTLPGEPALAERLATGTAYRDLSLTLSRLIIFVNRAQ